MIQMILMLVAPQIGVFFLHKDILALSVINLSDRRIDIVVARYLGAGTHCQMFCGEII